MNVDQLFGQIRPICKLIGVAMVIVAALKLFGVHIDIGGSVEATALVGIGLLHV